MCVVAFALDGHPRYRLILAANRDEYHARPSAPLARWDGADSHIIAGRDLLSGGTWAGVSDTGRVAIVTNISTGAAPDPAKLSRGDLVADFLRHGLVPERPALYSYNPFSLLTIGPNGAQLIANLPEPLFMPVAPGIHGLSNSTPRDPWPRKARLMQAFADYIEISDENLTDTLFALLASESIDDSIFIRNAVYGTRCSTVLLVDRNGQGRIVERTFDPHGNPEGQNQELFEIG